jgi:Apea-like HEPN
MTIPKNDAFEAFLTGCSVVREKPADHFIVLGSRRGIVTVGRSIVDLYLTYPDAGLQFDSVVRVVADSLAKVDSPHSYHVAIATIALIVETRPRGRSAVEHANCCLANTTATQLRQSVVVPGRPRSSYELRLGTYTMRAFNPEKLLYWAERCGSAYPIDLRELRGWAAIEREPIDMNLIDWTEPLTSGPALSKWGTAVVSDSFLDAYYSEIAHGVAQEINLLLKRDVLVLESAAMLWIGIENLLDSLFVKTITYFVWKAVSGRNGWATFSDQSGLHANFTPQEGLAECREWLLNELGFTNLSELNPLDKSIETFCRFLQRAHGHRLEGRPDEAFLHFAIALDLLFGTQGRSTDSVAQRTALVVHRQVSRVLDEQVKRCKRLYEVRSKYVHEGRDVADADLEEIDSICTEVLWTLLAASAKRNITNFDEWLRKVDHLFTGLRAAMELPESEFQRVGIPPPGHMRRPPLRVER